VFVLLCLLFLNVCLCVCACLQKGAPYSTHGVRIYADAADLASPLFAALARLNFAVRELASHAQTGSAFSAGETKENQGYCG
jgi:hypothetical protein